MGLYSGFLKNMANLAWLRGGRRAAVVKSEPGAGVQRAAKRLADHRAAQAERLENAAPPKVTRQQTRSFAIRGR